VKNVFVIANFEKVTPDISFFNTGS